MYYLYKHIRFANMLVSIKKQGHSLGNRQRCTKHMVGKVSACERVGENECACETDMNFIGRAEQWKEALMTQPSLELQQNTCTFTDYQKPQIQQKNRCSVENLGIKEWE